MFKRMLFLIMTLFVCTVSAVAVGEDYTLFTDNTGQVSVAKPYACTFDFLSTYGNETITMTPIYRKNCDVGYYNSSNDQCDIVAKYCDPGNYLDLTSGTPVCTPCPAGSWCPSRYLSVETVNESAEVCGGVDNIAEGGKTEANANYKWENNQCINKSTNEVVAGITSAAECGYTSVGKCKCPGDTTTNADRKASSGLRSTSITACVYYDLKPGQQLKRTADAEHNYKWENGKCIDKDTNEVVPDITSAAYCGYTYSKQECDQDNFCTGRIVTAAKYEDSMEQCPDKYNDVVTIENAADCATAATNGFTWDESDGGKCFITGTSVVVSNVTTSWACDNANQIKSDLVWNASENKCLLKGHAVAGSFRCSYTCPAGYYMHITNQYDVYTNSHSVSDYYTSKYFLGGWKALYTTCEPCPVGYYCLGGTFFLDTKYNAATYSTEQTKYYSNGTSLDGTPDTTLTHCPTNSTTLGTGSYQADQCKSFCPAGQYYNATEPDKGCKSCKDAGLPDDAYCPGGDLYDNNTSEDVGISSCEQQNVALYGSDINDAPVIIKPDDNLNNYIQPNEGRSACTCPEGYEWNPTTRACCEPNKACCGAGLDLHTYTDGTYECKPCGSGNEEQDEKCRLICSIDSNSLACHSCRNNDYCPGYVMVIKTPCVPKANEFVTQSGECKLCSAVGAVVNAQQTSCSCDLAEMRRIHGLDSSKFAELSDDQNLMVRHLGASMCELDEYYVGIRYNTIDLNGNTNPHGKSCGWNSQCDYWSKYYQYGHVKEGNQYVEANEFTLDWNPSEHGYNFSNPVTPEETLLNPESNLKRKVKGGEGYLFAGWCRGKKDASESSNTTFCCPAGYMVQSLGGDKKECVICPNGDTTSPDCDGSRWLAPDKKPVIETKKAYNRFSYNQGFKYYAMMVADYECKPGWYLNTTKLECEPCLEGHWCPGGAFSTRDNGLRACDPGTYRGSKGATQQEYNTNPDPELNIVYDGCKPCYIGVSEELGGVEIPADDNGLITRTSGSTSVDQCGYYCNEGKYDNKDDHRFQCDTTCTPGWYCPAGGPVPQLSTYVSKFYDWKHPGEGRIKCPDGLNSAAGARQCYIDPGCSVQHYQWQNGQCIDEDTREVVAEITSESDCHYIGYYKKKNASGAYECVICDGNSPSNGVYYACPGIKHNLWENGKCIDKDTNEVVTGVYSESKCRGDVPLVYYQTVHQDFVGRNNCGPNQMSDEHGDHCYALTNAGMYTDPATGNPAQCQINHFCNGKEENGVYGQKRCPYGSVSDVGAQTVMDCHCVSGANYMPTGAYIEKGGELQYDANTNEYICVNTYLVIGNVNSYSSVPENEDSIPNAEARIVSCAWVNNQENPAEDAAPDGTYRKCTPAALDICYKSDWNNQNASSVSTSDVLTELARVLYENDENEEHRTIKYLLANMTEASDVKNISTVNEWAACRGLSVCPEDFSHYDDSIGICYASIEYLGLDDGLSLSNPDRYVLDDLPITLLNPSKTHYKFVGWCLDSESTEDCLANTVHTENGADVVERTIQSGTGGDLTFVAQWQMVCPTEDGFVHYDGDELTDVSQCYATVAFNTKGGMPVPEMHKAYYTEGATSYTLNSLPQTQLNGYDFDGWYQVENPTETDAVVTTETELSGDRTLYAAWSLVPYTITYVENGGVEIADATYNITDTQPDGYVLATTTKTGYGLDGWCMYDAEQTPAVTTCDTASLANSLLPNTTGNKWAYAQWTPITYTVEFDGNDATGGTTESESFTYDEEKALTANGFTKTGYNFVGWCDAWNSETNVCAENANNYSDEQVVSNLTTENDTTITLYAQWAPIVYTITYNGIDGASLAESNPSTYTIETESITLNNPTKDDYNFVGWCEGAENENCETPQETITIAQGSTGDKVFWAKWQAATCPVEFPTKDSETGICYASVVYYGIEGATLPEDPENPGVALTNPDRYDADTELPIVLNKPNKDYYEFDGWYDNAEFSGEAATEIPAGSTGDKSFWAKWTPIEYTITYNGMDGASLAESNPSTYTIETESITLNNPTKDDYNFVGWCDDEELTQDCSTEKTIAQGSTGDKVFWAKWSVKTYTVVFNSNATDAEGSKENRVCSYGEACDDIANNDEITRTDYGFVGWMLQPDGTVADYTNSVTITEELTDGILNLYALWTPQCNTGKYLHVGDTKMCLYATSRTTPSLVILIDDVKYYANMCKAFECDTPITDGTDNKLHIMYNDEVYNVYDLTAQ